MILNSSKQRITGVVTEPDVKEEYIGTTTPTAKVTINPETKEISVDVIASGFLGETATTAYPGNDGALATKLAVKALKDVEEETNRAKQAELELKEHIESFTETIQLGDAAVQTRVEEETRRAITSESALRKNLQELTDASNTNFNTVYDKFVEVNTTIKTTRKELSSSIRQLEDDIFDELVDITDDFSAQINSITSNHDKFEDYAESTYAKQSEVNKLIVHVNEHVDTQIQQLNQDLSTTKSDLTAEIHKVESDALNRINDVQSTLSSDIDKLSDNQKALTNRIKFVEQNYVTTDSFNENISNVTTDLSNQIKTSEKTLQKSLDNLSSSVDQSVGILTDKINNEVSATNEKIDTIDTRVDTIESSYATKNYVHEEVHNAITLSKQVIDSVDLDNNTVTINTVLITPIDGVLYMLLDPTADVEDIYKEYTTIDGKLTLIGDTSVSLDGYATEEYVNQQIDSIPEVDLTDYAKKSEIPDVSSFIDKIPEEYVTEEELNEKGYYNLTQITDLLKSLEFIDGGNAPSL